MELRERDRLIARIVPANGEAPAEWPDFAARRKEIFGDRVLDAVDMLIAERRRARYRAFTPTRVISSLSTCLIAVSGKRSACECDTPRCG